MLKFFTRYNDRFVSKWLVLLMDIFLVGFGFIFSVVVRFNFDFTYLDPTIFKYHLLWVILIRTATFLFFQTYVGIIRHTSIEDAKLLFKAAFYSSFQLICFNLLPDSGLIHFIHIPYSIVFIDFFVVLFALVASRFLIKAIFESLANSFKSNKKIIIYGSGRLGIIAKNTLLGDKKNSYSLLCFIDDNPQKIGKSLEGVKVISKKDLKNQIQYFRKEEVEIIFAIQSISVPLKNDIVDEFLEMGLKVRVVPPVKHWINGELSSNQIQDISIEDLLERPSIQINNSLVNSFIESKKVMITGAAGSIGSEIVRQILNFNPTELVLIDQAESPMYDLETELTRIIGNKNTRTKISFEIRNITNEVKMDKVFEMYLPQVVFHAAAYKHVPMMEDNPFKAVEVNTFGTQLMADLASKYKVEKFVFVSTDKAVNPTNVMGASKRAAEIYVQSLNKSHKNETRFIVTRFGNVLGSNGSVIPLFKKQIKSGGPVTVTHPDIIRYFMTIPEACQLVLEAGTMGRGGEIYVFDMGVPVRIYDLAKKMIKLSGFELDTQIKIEFSGLRAGEKLFEELLNSDETSVATHHPKIMVAKVRVEEFENIKHIFSNVKGQINLLSPEEIVLFLKELVPEFQSNNSPFSRLDKVKT